MSQSDARAYEFARAAVREAIATLNAVESTQPKPRRWFPSWDYVEDQLPGAVDRLAGRDRDLVDFLIRQCRHRGLAGVTVCEDTGTLALDGVCPVHEGDACLVVPAAYVGENRRLHERLTRLEAAAREVRTTFDGGASYNSLPDAVRNLDSLLAERDRMGGEGRGRR